jgi:hypothetical protein
MTLQAGGQDPRVHRTGPSRRGLGSPRLVWGAFATSVALHVAFIVAYPALFGALEPASAQFYVPPSSEPTGELEVMRIVEIDVPPEVEPPDQPELEPVVARTVVTPTPPSASEGPVVDFARPGISAADRLRMTLTDRRLWAPLPTALRELTLEQREELALSGRIAEWYDSIQAVAAAEAAWTDWTFTDGDGNRWGISDGQLHLGGLTLPLPVFGAAPGAARERAWQWDEISRQGNSVAVQQTVRERMEAIRARRDRERAEARGDTTGAPG